MTTTVLIVDDSTSVRKMVESALRMMRYSVLTAADGLEALEVLEKKQVDLAIFDVNMPRMDGLSLLKTVRERPEWAELPILMLTTEGQEADIERALTLGATAYMRKPFKPGQLLAQLKRLDPS